MFHDAGVKLTQIQKILLKMNIENISSLQIQSVIEREKIETFNLESEELEQYMKSKFMMQHIVKKYNCKIKISRMRIAPNYPQFLFLSPVLVKKIQEQ